MIKKLAAANLALAVSAWGMPPPVYTAAEVESYAAGSGVSSALTAPGAALSLPAESTGNGPRDGNLSPFNPHYRAGEIVQVGFNGSLTLRLERFVRVEPGRLHLGVWENVFVVATSGMLVGNPPAFFGADSAVLEVSKNGVDFVSLGAITFDGFGNYWTDSSGPYSKIPGTVRADFGRPFFGNRTLLAGADYARVLDFLDGTAGGTWIDLSRSGLDEVGWVRFSGVAANATLEIDAVAINTSLAGAPTKIPSLSIDPALPVRVVLAESLAHASYQLQVSDDLATGWRNHGEPLQGTGGALVFQDFENPPQRFYRVLLP